ncbi:MAG: phospholipid carrier-dependent glycosyltransferase [Actinomycetota bacterium]|nr:phospholipid carrier-dependent glycosyltransferase [Actinomycetota bacterium]
MAAVTLEPALSTDESATTRHSPGARTARLRTRLVGTPPGDRLLGWLGPLVVAAIGGFLRFWNLGSPHQLIFDETYYVKEGWSMILFGVEMKNNPGLEAAKQIDQNFTAGNVRTVYDPTVGDLVVHPPVGKWLIGWGEQLFGITNSFGWRFSVCVLGTLSIVMVGRAARRMFGSSLLGTVAAILLAFDGQHFVHSRTGLLDLIVMFFGFAAFCFLLIDRDHSRAVLAQRVGRVPRPELSRFGPSMGWRPWRWAAGACLGLSTGTKWSGLYFVVAFGVMTVLWDMGARRAAGVRGWKAAWLVRDSPYAFLQLVVTTAVVYCLSWWGWFATSTGYNRHWADTHGSTRWGWVPSAVRSWWNYHSQMLEFNITLHSDHPYKTNPWSWMIQGRPTSFFYEGPKKGSDGCTVEICSKAITSIGTVSVWWGGTLALVVLLFMWALRRDWRAGAVLAGFAGGYLPWFALQERTIYSFYTVAFVPWVVLACTYVLGLAIGPPTATRQRRQVGLLVTGLFCVLTVSLFAFFYPIYTAQVVPQDFWRAHMWFPSWV